MTEPLRIPKVFDGRDLTNDQIRRLIISLPSQQGELLDDLSARLEIDRHNTDKEEKFYDYGTLNFFSVAYRAFFELSPRGSMIDELNSWNERFFARYPFLYEIMNNLATRYAYHYKEAPHTEKEALAIIAEMEHYLHKFDTSIIP